MGLDADPSPTSLLLLSALQSLCESICQEQSLLKFSGSSGRTSPEQSPLLCDDLTTGVKKGGAALGLSLKNL